MRSGESKPADLEKIVAAILAAPKLIDSPIRWRQKNRNDYVISRLRVKCPDFPSARLTLIIGVQFTRLPLKVSFSLFLGNERIYSLDTNPRRSHNNGRGLGSVKGTHWSTYPCTHVVEDDRDLLYQQWFTEFMARAKIKFIGRYRPPPYEPKQLGML